MSARSLSVWQTWLDEEALQPAKRIVTTVPDQVIDDLEYCLDAAQLILSDTFAYVQCETDASYTTVRTYSMYTKDYADAASPATYASHSVYVRGWVSASAQGLVRVTGGNGNCDFTAITATSPAWYLAASSYEIATHGTQVDLVLTGAVTNPGDILYIDGWMIVAEDES